MTLSHELRVTPCPFKPTLIRWADAVDNGYRWEVAKEMRLVAGVKWPGVTRWRVRLYGWADRVEEEALRAELEPQSLGGAIAGLRARQRLRRRQTLRAVQ